MKDLNIKSVQGILNIRWYNSLNVSNELYSLIKVIDNNGNHLPWTKGFFTQMDSYNSDDKVKELTKEGFNLKHIYKKNKLQAKDILNIEKWLEDTNISTDPNFKDWEFDGYIIEGEIDNDRAMKLNSCCRYY